MPPSLLLRSAVAGQQRGRGEAEGSWQLRRFRPDFPWRLVKDRTNYVMTQGSQDTAKAKYSLTASS